MKTDRIFTDHAPGFGGFTFDAQVADVFDDMIVRSVPLYAEVQRAIPTLAQLLDHEVLRVVDLGCSTGTSLIHLAQSLPERALELIGVDNSEPMLARCKEKLATLDLHPKPTIVHSDLQAFSFSDASIVLMNYTLQFIDRENRQALLQRIRSNIRPGGFLLVSEKVSQPEPAMDNALTELYFEFKRQNGYSELEIARKRDALENVLVPLTLTDNVTLLQSSGFQRVDLLLKWFNFATLIAYV